MTATIHKFGFIQQDLLSKRSGACKGMLSAVLLWAFCSLAWSSPPTAAQRPAAEEFKTLRAIAGHFGGGAWNDAVDKWNGKKHQVMQELSTQVIQGDYQAEQLITLMGRPDRVWSEADEGYSHLLRHTEWQGPAQGEFWAYYWRGPHDQLLFALKAGKVTAAGWLLSWE